jgi:hypothetical protein
VVGAYIGFELSFGGKVYITERIKDPADPDHPACVVFDLFVLHSTLLIKSRGCCDAKCPFLQYITEELHIEPSIALGFNSDARIAGIHFQVGSSDAGLNAELFQALSLGKGAAATKKELWNSFSYDRFLKIRNVDAAGKSFHEKPRLAGVSKMVMIKGFSSSRGR